MKPYIGLLKSRKYLAVLYISRLGLVGTTAAVLSSITGNTLSNLNEKQTSCTVGSEQNKKYKYIYLQC